MNNVITVFELFNSKKEEFRYTAFIYKGDKQLGDDSYKPVRHKTKNVTMFEEFTVMAKDQDAADKLAAKKVVELYPKLKYHINFWRKGERGEGLMDKFRIGKNLPKYPTDYEAAWD